MAGSFQKKCIKPLRMPVQNAEQSQQSTDGQTKTDGEVTDVDFEEVKDEKK